VGFCDRFSQKPIQFCSPHRWEAMGDMFNCFFGCDCGLHSRRAQIGQACLSTVFLLRKALVADVSFQVQPRRTLDSRLQFPLPAFQILPFLRWDHRLGDALFPVLRRALGYTLKP
jgi:hypothetical protein